MRFRHIDPADRLELWHAHQIFDGVDMCTGLAQLPWKLISGAQLSWELGFLLPQCHVRQPCARHGAFRLLGQAQKIAHLMRLVKAVRVIEQHWQSDSR